jgi:hypothetical protein
MKRKIIAGILITLTLMLGLSVMVFAVEKPLFDSESVVIHERHHLETLSYDELLELYAPFIDWANRVNEFFGTNIRLAPTIGYHPEFMLMVLSGESSIESFIECFMNGVIFEMERAAINTALDALDTAIYRHESELLLNALDKYGMSSFVEIGFLLLHGYQLDAVSDFLALEEHERHSIIAEIDPFSSWEIRAFLDVRGQLNVPPGAGTVQAAASGEVQAAHGAFGITHFGTGRAFVNLNQGVLISNCIRNGEFTHRIGVHRNYAVVTSSNISFVFLPLGGLINGPFHAIYTAQELFWAGRPISPWW